MKVILTLKDIQNMKGEKKKHHSNRLDDQQILLDTLEHELNENLKAKVKLL